MRKLVIGLIVLLLFAFCVQAQDYEIRIGAKQLSPAELTINVQDSVKFTNLAGMRAIVFDDGSETATMSAGTSSTKKFNETGTFPFQVEGAPNMTGVVTVVESGAPPPPVVYTEETVPKGEEVFVLVGDYFYNPSSITVSVGDTVVWENVGNVVHSVDFFEDGPKKLVNGDKLFNRTFLTPGEYHYKCRYHNAMKGSVTVLSLEDAQKIGDAQTLETSQEPSTESPGQVQDTFTPTPTVSRTALDSRINQLRKELKAEIAEATPVVSADVSEFQTQLGDIQAKLDDFQTQLTTSETDIVTLQQQATQLDQRVRSQPVVEQPQTTPPVMVYFSLGLDLLFVFILIGLGVYLLRKKPARMPTSFAKPTLFKDKKPHEGVSSVVKSKKLFETNKSLDSLNKELGKSPLDKRKGHGELLADLKKPINAPQSYIAKCRAKGLSDDVIVSKFVKSGWSKEQAMKLVKNH